MLISIYAYMTIYVSKKYYFLFFFDFFGDSKQSQKPIQQPLIASLLREQITICPSRRSSTIPESLKTLKWRLTVDCDRPTTATISLTVISLAASKPKILSLERSLKALKYLLYCFVSIITSLPAALLTYPVSHRLCTYNDIYRKKFRMSIVFFVLAGWNLNICLLKSHFLARGLYWYSIGLH